MSASLRVTSSLRVWSHRKFAVGHWHHSVLRRHDIGTAWVFTSSASFNSSISFVFLAITFLQNVNIFIRSGKRKNLLKSWACHIISETVSHRPAVRLVLAWTSRTER